METARWVLAFRRSDNVEQLVKFDGWLDRDVILAFAHGLKVDGFSQVALYWERDRLEPVSLDG